MGSQSCASCDRCSRAAKPAAPFNRDLPLDWMLSVLLELMHAASDDVNAGFLPEDKAERTLITTILGALGSFTPDRAG